MGREPPSFRKMQQGSIPLLHFYYTSPKSFLKNFADPKIILNFVIETRANTRVAKWGRL